MLGFNSSVNRLDDVAEYKKLCTTKTKFGITLLDDAFGGIFDDDLVVMTAKTGAGKTELATQLAYTNAKAGRNVHLFALEAYHGEIETRLMFRKVAEKFFKNRRERHIYTKETPNFQDWVYNRQTDLLRQYESDAYSELIDEVETLHTYYRHEKFDIEDFEAQLARIGRDTELVICDHLHYFDLESSDENRDLKRTAKKIRDLTMFYRKPTVLVAHIRKQDKRYSTLVPDIEDIYGSSDISKIATKIFAVAPARDIEQDPNNPHLYPTYIRILKNRLDGSRSYYSAICTFDIQRNCYEDEYCLGKFQSDGNFEEAKKIPKWAEHHRSILSGNRERPSKPYDD